MMKYILLLLKSERTVFTYSELGLFFSISNIHTLRNIVERLKKQQLLVTLHKGIYGLPNYDEKELAIKLKTPSYIGLETVLQAEGVVFQDYSSTIFTLSTNTKTYQINDLNISIHKLKMSLLLSPIGIIQMPNYAISTKERAICDRLYLSPDYYFDNTKNLNVELLEELKNIYPKTTSLSIQQIINDNKI